MDMYECMLNEYVCMLVKWKCMYARLSRKHVKMVLIQTVLPRNVYVYFENVFIMCMRFSTLSGGSYNSPNFSETQE